MRLRPHDDDDPTVLAREPAAWALVPGPSRPALGGTLRDLAGRRATRFCAVGLLGTLLNLVVYETLVLQGAMPAIAAVCAFVVAVAHNHLLNRVWAFGRREAPYLTQGGRFLVVSVATLGLNLVVLHALLEAGAGHLAAQMAGIAAATPVSYAGHRGWTFRERA